MSETWTVTMPQAGRDGDRGCGRRQAQAGRRHRRVRRPALPGSPRTRSTRRSPAPYDGVILEILVSAGETVPVGTPLVRIGEPRLGPRCGVGRRGRAIRRRPGDRRVENRSGDRRTGNVVPPASSRSCTTSPCQSSARPSPRARWATGSRPSATRWPSTTRCSRCRPTRSTRRSPATRRRPRRDTRASGARRCPSEPRWPDRRARSRGRGTGCSGGAGTRGSCRAVSRPGTGRRQRQRGRPALAARPPARRRATSTWRGVPGTGVGGRIRREDVEKAIATAARRLLRPLSPGGFRSGSGDFCNRGPPLRRRRRIGTPSGGGDPRDEVQPLSRMRLALASGLKGSQMLAASVPGPRSRSTTRSRQGACPVQAVQEGDRLLPVVPALRRPRGGRRVAHVPDGPARRSTSKPRP